MRMDGGAAEAALWHDFLATFGLRFAVGPGRDGYNRLARGVYPIASGHPIFAGVSELYQWNGNSVQVLDSDNPDTALLIAYPTAAVQAYGMYDPIHALTQEPVLVDTAPPAAAPALTLPPPPPPAFQEVLTAPGWFGGAAQQTASAPLDLVLDPAVNLQPGSGTITFWPADDPTAVQTLAQGLRGHLEFRHSIVLNSSASMSQQNKRAPSFVRVSVPIFPHLAISSLFPVWGDAIKPGER